MKLRNYQVRIIENCCKELRQNKKSLIVLPTGSGKTVIFSHIINQLKCNTLVLAHTQDLVMQIKKSIFQIFPELKKWVDVRTVQSLNRNSTFFDLLVIDECHRAASKSYRRIINMHPDAMYLGATATPFRLDNQCVYKIFGFPFESFSLIDMIKEGFLCDFIGYRVQTKISLLGIKRGHGDFTTPNLSSVINVKERNTIIVNEYQKIAPESKAVAFCCSIQHANDLATEFRKKGISSIAISGIDSNSQRENILNDFRQGTIQVLCNCNLLTEGFDEPSIECLIMARPTLSKGLYIQMIGRGARLFKNKNVCKVIEFTDNCFDVCHLDILLDKKNSVFKLKNGELLTSSRERLKKELENFSGEIVVEKMNIIIPKTIYERPATIYQRKLLKDRNIKYEEPLTEFIANQLLGV